MGRRLSRRDRLVWIDLEMTGLDETQNVVVEIATIITEADLSMVAEGPDLVIHATDEDLAKMVPVVQEMHAANGLIDEIRTSEIDVAQAERETLAFVKEHCAGARIHPLCGNSIGTDRRFIARHMPELDHYLHYRTIDVSSIKELAKRWNRPAFARRPDKGKGHRALADIQESIAELQYYHDAVFRVEGAPAVDAPTDEDE